MNDKEWYQGIPKSHAALVYGEVSEDNSPRHIQAYFGQEAYEMLQMHIYMKELLRVEDEPEYVCWSPGFGLLWAATEVLGTSARFRSAEKASTLVFEEIGSTLFSSVNKMQKLHARYNGLIDPKQLRYFGIEPSRMFARTAELIHPAIEIRHYSDWHDLPPAETLTIARSYQASSYAFRNVDDLGSWVFRSTCSLHGLWFSLSSGDEVIHAHGKRVTLFSVDRFCSEAANRGFSVLPVSSERYSFGEHEFISAFLLAHRFDRRQKMHFAELCSRDANYGIDGFSPAGVGDPVDWIRSKADFKGSHAGYIEPLQQTPLQSPMFNFGNRGVLTKFQDYLDKLTT